MGQDGSDKVNRGDRDAVATKPPGQEAGLGLDKGLKRDKNEDSAAAVNVRQASEAETQSVGIYAVADGVGGAPAGEVASKLAVRTAVRQLMDDITTDDDMPDNYRQWLHQAVNVANRVVQKKGEQNEAQMGTTLVMAVVVGDQIHVANVGDSRAYLVTSQGLRQITEDHTYTQKLLDAGLIKPEEVKQHPYRNVLTQAIGLSDDIKEDQVDATLGDGDMLLLCSDGLFRDLDEDAIWDVIRHSNEPQAACEALIAAANRAGGGDNIAAVLVRLQPA